ncbi:hypothetical protein GCM10010393_42040 [Streptomyces gobitricini]|uniref:Uncharacterized protein n=1 Tax=Streptomyces gobitricini TaxID=68211 RepID=A0ABP5ZXP4_9ACTN
MVGCSCRATGSSAARCQPHPSPGRLLLDLADESVQRFQRADDVRALVFTAARLRQAREDWMTSTRFGEVKGYDGAPLPAPEVPATPLKARGRVR